MADRNPEAERLAALRSYGILDTDPEEAFDRVVRLAHSLFGLPMALVSLIDEQRQWFKARIGLDVRETPRSWSFCNHAIQQDEPLVVRDATSDPRFRDNPLVTGEPNIRFYAGAPIRDREGHALGTVCVISPVANIAFSAEDAERLESLAGIVANELALRRQLRRASRHIAEQQTFIQEVHYHVAESFQIVTDILDYQSDHVRNPEAKLQLKNAARRVLAIGEVHQQLRLQSSANEGNVRDYLGRLMRRVSQGLMQASADPTTDVQVPVDLVLNNDLMARLGLAATAVAMQAIRLGAVAISVAVEPNATELVLAVGYQAATAARYDLSAEGSGMRLIRLLAGQNSIALDPDNPQRIMVRFRR